MIQSVTSCLLISGSALVDWAENAILAAADTDFFPLTWEVITEVE